ncbi:hypothetical protein ACI2L4_37720 [Streptomyces sparsogenes]|uniref:hypothetical protein n=1 Tax=Streptomyces sparsogenes TaxID=67365 RepID=UPI00340A60F0
MHPDEPQDQPTSNVEIDINPPVMRGGALTEVCAAELAFYKDDPAEYARLADWLAELGVPVSTRHYDAIYEPEVAMDPDELFDGLSDAEFERLTSR